MAERARPAALTALELLAEVPVFAGLPDAVLRRLAATAETQALPAGALLFEQGAMPRHLHVLLEGQVGPTLRAHGVRTTGATVQVDDAARLAAFADPDDIPDGVTPPA